MDTSSNAMDVIPITTRVINGEFPSAFLCNKDHLLAFQEIEHVI